MNSKKFFTAQHPGNDPFEPAYSLADLYHLNTKLVNSLRPVSLTDEELSTGVWGLHSKQFSSAQKIALPATCPEPSISLSQAIRARHSTREWQEKALSQEQLSTLLRLGAGIVRFGELGGRPAYYHGAPSGGGRYPLEIYPVVFRVDGLEPGVYHYNVLEHALDVLYLDSEIVSSLLKSTVYPDYVEGAGVVFLMTAVFERTTLKYSDRGYRYILLEAGHVAQNICLVAEGLELGSLCLAGFYEQSIEQLLWIDGFSESLVYVVTLGVPASSESAQ
ncbi:MAG TPA: SagB/ThcOx family dehydrogenase [Ktedonobacteraceae bacterium]